MHFPKQVEVEIIAYSSFHTHRKLLENMKSQKYRSQHQLFVAEGHRIIREALEHGVTPAALYFTRLKLVAALKAAPSKLKLEDVHALSDLPLFKTPYKTLQTWSSVTTSPGIVGEYLRCGSSVNPSLYNLLLFYFFYMHRVRNNKV